MAKPLPYDWYLKEWLPTLGVNATWLEQETGWTHRIASQLINRKTRWNRDHLALAATVLKIAPFELLMHPDEAMHVRNLRGDAEKEYRMRVADKPTTWTPAPTELPILKNSRNGTNK